MANKIERWGLQEPFHNQFSTLWSWAFEQSTITNHDLLEGLT
jgi:hypothetical protein